MPRPNPSSFAAHWDLDPSVVFLNHGSFGACPRVVLDKQRELQRQLEAQPVRFLYRELEGMFDTTRDELAGLVGCAAEDLGLVTNATQGVNAVLRSLALSAADELLVTDHEYNACRNALDFVAERSGARVVVAKIPFPLQDPQQVIDAVLACVTERTRLLLIDHVTSPTGLVLPVEPIVAALRERGIDTLVDGAHAPGMLPLDLRAMDPAYYTGNCHKWLCTPKGSALLYVRRDLQPSIRPLSISHGANSPRTDRSRFRLEFDFTGTHDPTAWLCIPEALRFLRELMPGGLPGLRQHNHELALKGRQLLCDAIGCDAPAPDSMIGSLASVMLPVDPAHDPLVAIDPLQSRLWDEHRIEVPIMLWPNPPLRLLRISPQAYNSLEQYEWLAEAVASARR